MKLKSLEIELQTYGVLEGQYTGKIRFIDPAGMIDLAVPPELANQLLLASSQGLADVSALAARTIHEAVTSSIQALQPKTP